MKAPERKAETALTDVRRLLDDWRKSGRPGKTIPARLWQEAIELTKAHGVSTTARALGLNFRDLKKRIEAGGSGAAVEPAQRFVELSAGDFFSGSECTVEVESEAGIRLRVSLRGRTTAEVAAVVAAIMGEAKR